MTRLAQQMVAALSATKQQAAAQAVYNVANSITDPQGLLSPFFDLAVPTATLLDGLDTINFPNWTVSRVTLTSLAVVADSGWPGGLYVEAIPSALSGSVTLRADLATCTPMRSLTPRVIIGGVLVGTTVINYQYDVDFYQADGVTLISSGGAANPPISGAGTHDPLAYLLTTPITPPINARFVALRIGLYEGTTHDAGTRLRVGAVSFSQP